MSEVAREILFTAARVKYHGNVLHCSRHRTLAENIEECLEVLARLTGEDRDEWDDTALTIEAYRSS